MTPFSGPSLDLVLASAIAGARRSLRRLARRGLGRQPLLHDHPRALAR